MVRPTRADQCWHFDVFEGRSFRCPVLVIQWVGCCLSEEVFLHQEFSIVPTLDPTIGPSGYKAGLRYSTVERELAVWFGDTLPRDDREQVRRIEGCHSPLRHSQIRNTHEADTAGT